MSEVSTSLDPLGTSFARPFARKTRRISLSLSRFDLPRRPGYVSPLFLPRTQPWSLSRVGSDETTTAKVAIGDRRGRDAEGEGIEILSGPRAREGGPAPLPGSLALSPSRALSPSAEIVPRFRGRQRVPASPRPFSRLPLPPNPSRACACACDPACLCNRSGSEPGQERDRRVPLGGRRFAKKYRKLRPTKGGKRNQIAHQLLPRSSRRPNCSSAPANVVSAPISAKMGGRGDRDSREAERGRRPQPRKKKKTPEKRERGSVCGGRGW